MDSNILYHMHMQFKEVLQDNLLDDEVRDISFKFATPSFLGLNHKFGIILPNQNFYYQIVIFLSIQTFVAACFAIPLYFLFIVPEKRIKLSDHALTTSYLIGFGVILPFMLYQPIWMINHFNVKSLAIKMLLLSLPITCPLRMIEVICGYSPPAAKKDLKMFMLYFSCLMGLSFGKRNMENPRRVSSKYFVSQLMKLGRDYMLITPLLSFLKAKRYAIFHTGFEVDSTDHSLYDLLSWKHLANNYCNALLLSVSLSQSTLGVSIMYNLVFGYESTEVVQNPMLKSKSPTDFWGRRWNILVHSLLKNGTFKPVRKYYGRSVAVLATFMVSGLLHEYVNLILLSEVRKSIEWKNTVFFLWNGIIIYTESKIGHWFIFQWMSRNLPNIFITSLVILTALPLGHLFTGEYIAGGYFDNISPANFLVVTVD